MLSRRRAVVIIAGSAFVLGVLSTAAVAAVARRPPVAEPLPEAERTAPRDDPQAELCARVAVRATEYRAARGNDLRRSDIRHRRDADLLALRQHLAGWTGEIIKLGTNGDGKAYLAVKLSCADADVTLHTWTMAILDANDDTLFPPSSPLFATLSSLEEGAKVRFGGDFTAVDDNGAIRETSLTERGGMRAPELVFRFTDIVPLP